MFALSNIPNAMRRLALCLILALAGLATVLASSPARSNQNTAYALEIDGAIGPASAAFVGESLERARKEGAMLAIIKMDTPGGLDTSMRQIIQDILAMPIPVVAYVHPSGARAASAGTYILYASHIAAMTPGTNLGAATPIQIGAAPGQPDESGGDKQTAQPKSAQERKAVNDAVAYIRSLAELRERNADWAEKAVREAASLSANAALEQNVIDIVAKDTASLLRQLDGRKVIVDGKSRELSTSGIALVEIEPGWTTRFLATITDPNVALILMMIGIYGLFFEFMNPGSFVPGTVGAISLLIALYALAALPVDFAGLSLILLGLALMVAEAFAPSFGIMGIGGVAAFVFGAAILFDTDVPGFRVDRPIIAALGIFSAVLLVFVARIGLKSLRSPIQTGQQEMIGAQGRVLDWKDGRGHVYVHSERWDAVGPPSLAEGASIEVESVEGLRLSVSPRMPKQADMSGGKDGYS